MDKAGFRVAALYRFAPVADPAALRDALEALCGERCAARCWWRTRG